MSEDEEAAHMLLDNYNVPRGQLGENDKPVKYTLTQRIRWLSQDVKKDA